jgi:hypothetical protein
MLSIIILDEFFYCIEIKIGLLKRQIVFFKRIRILKKIDRSMTYSKHLHLKRHLSVIEEPILCKEADMIIALDECEVRTNIELVLILACHLKEDFLLTKEPELVFKIRILRLRLELETL